jgi:hypothetical protein
MPRFAIVNNGFVVNTVDLPATEFPAPNMVLLPNGSLAAPGWRWENGAPVQVVDPRIWWIDLGPFKGRLGADGMAISVSTNPTCMAVREQLYDRKYIDLKGPELATMIGMLIGQNQPTANPAFPGSAPMTAARAAQITGTPTTEAERHIKGLS